MSADPQRHDPFTDAIRKQSSQARRRKTWRWWHGLGIFGVVGWMVVTPTLVGIALGRLLDARFDSGISWTLSLLLVGVVLGCTAAWRSVRESLR